MSMIQYTTYDIQLRVKKPNALEGLSNVYFTLKQNFKTIVTKEIPIKDLDISNNTIPVSLSQEETGLFGLGPAELQVNFLYNNGDRKASVLKHVIVTENLIKEVL